MTIDRLLRISHQRVRSLFRKDAVDGEVSRELAFHFDQLIEENIAAGMFPADARRAARRALGNVASLEEQCRDQRGVRWLHDLRQDLVYGLRTLVLDRAFTIVAVISLALGIGANAATLRVISSVAFEPLPFPDADRLVLVRTFGFETPSQVQPATIPEYVTWKDAIQSVDSMGASLADQADLGADSHGPAERLAGHLFDSDVFRTLGVQPSRGRVFEDRDFDATGNGRSLVISDRLWRRRFAASETIVGRQIRFNGSTAEIIGVMPGSFTYPNERADYWAPLRIAPGRPGSAPFYQVVARMKPHVAIEEVQADLERLSVHVARGVPGRLERRGVRLEPLRDAFYAWVHAPLTIAQVGVLLVLLIGCANVTGLLLARGTVRAPEVAMRTALGAGRSRIVRQFLGESIVLSCVSGVLALPVAVAAMRALTSMMPFLGQARMPDVGVDGRLLLAIATLSVIACLIFGLFPAIVSSRTAPLAHIADPVRVGTSRRTQRFRGGLVAAQVALSLILLVGTGLLLNSLARVARRELNFEPRGLLMFEVRFRPATYVKAIGTHKEFAYYEVGSAPARTLEQIYDRLRTLPGVDTLAGISHPPASSFIIPRFAVTAEGEAEAEAAAARRDPAAYFLVTPGFFSTIKAPLVRGREIDRRDTAGAAWVVVINETMAQQLWPGADPIGKHLRLVDVPDDRPRAVVGVIRDIPTGLGQVERLPMIYASYLQQPSRFPGPWIGMFGQLTFLMRQTNPEVQVMPAARQAVAAIDPDRPLVDARPMDLLLGAALWARHGYVVVLGVFACAATLLAAIGIYGVTTYSVARRTREIGIRIALGAGAPDIVRLIGRGVMTMVAVGVAIGVAAALPLTQLISSQLWGVTPTDPATFAAVIALILVVALLACWLPVRRALHVDPTIALKCE
jgi:putative ABC transport system permease protein